MINNILIYLLDARSTVDSLLIQTDQVAKSAELINNNQSIIGLAENIINWSAMLFGAITLLIVVAGAVGLKEFNVVRRSRIEIKELHQEMRKELEELKLSKQLLLKENEKFLKIVYLLNDGIHYFHSGMLVKAEKKFSDVLKLNPNDYEALCYLSRTYFGLNRNEKAHSTIMKAISVSECADQAYYILGENQRRLKNFDEALKAFSKSIEYKENAITYTSMGYALFHSDMYNEAIDIFRNSYDLKKYSSPLCGLAKCFYSKNQIEKAKEYANTAIFHAKEEIKRGTDLVWPYYNVACSSLLLENDSCVELLQKALNKNNNPEVIKEQMNDYLKLKDVFCNTSLLNRCIQRLENKLNEIQ